MVRRDPVGEINVVEAVNGNTIYVSQYNYDLAGHYSEMSINGSGLIYIYFQIPLMLLVFLPAVTGLRQEWREATENLGGSTWDYWWLVGSRVLLPAFLGSTQLKPGRFNVWGSIIAVYVLAGFSRQSRISHEGALKYFLLGSFATGILIYGMAWTFGITGAINLDVIAKAGASIASGNPSLLLALLLLDAHMSANLNRR